MYWYSIYFVFSIFVISSSGNFHNGSLKNDDFLYFPEIPLNSNYEIDHRNTYNLRFDPNLIRRNLQIFTNNFENSHNSVYKEKMFNISNNEISIRDKYNNKGKNSTKSVHETNLIEIDKLLPTTTTISTQLSTNIMKPQKSHSTLNVIGNRLKDFFFGTSRTFVKGPINNRGFLNLFDIIKFENAPCFVFQNGVRMLNGTCYHKAECNSFGGIPIGICASGYGVCCICMFLFFFFYN